MDCYDANADVGPNQTGMFSVHRGDGSFDYNCDNYDEPQYSNIGSCDSWGTNVGDCTMNTLGWAGSVPACGQTAPFIVDNDSCSAGCEFLGVPFCCQETPSSATQFCR